jgi:hypothetical protein
MLVQLVSSHVHPAKQVLTKPQSNGIPKVLLAGLASKQPISLWP